MKLSGNVVLITGGSGGIGLAFAERFVKLGNQVIVCGRREDALQKQKNRSLNLLLAYVIWIMNPIVSPCLSG